MDAELGGAVLRVRADAATSLSSEPVFGHWSNFGGQLGEGLALTVWDPSASEVAVALASITAAAGQRFDLAAAGLGEGTMSVGWIHTGSIDAPSASVGDAVLFELTADADADSWVGRLVGEPVAAGVHVLRVREYTADELDALQACMDSATDPDVECPAFKMHVSVDPEPVVVLRSGDHIPDLS